MLLLRTAPTFLFLWTLIPLCACLATVYVSLLLFRVWRPMNPDAFPVLRRLRGALLGHRGGVGTNDPPTDKAFLLASGIAAAADPLALDLYDQRVPRNSLAAFRTARARGLAGVELDVQLTADGIAVVFHDEVVGRTLAVPARDADRAVASYTLAELQTLPFSAAYCGPAFTATERVPTLAAALAQLRADGLLAFVELKAFSPAVSRALAAAAVRAIVDARYASRAAIISFNPYALYCVRRLAEARGVATGLVFAHDVAANIERERARVGLAAPALLASAPAALLLGIVSRFCSHPRVLPLLGHALAVAETPAVSASLAAAYAQRGVALAAWVVNDASTQRWLLESLVGTVISDVPLPLPVALPVAVPTVAPADEANAAAIAAAAAVAAANAAAGVAPGPRASGSSASAVHTPVKRAATNGANTGSTGSAPVSAPASTAATPAATANATAAAAVGLTYASAAPSASATPTLTLSPLPVPALYHKSDDVVGGSVIVDNNNTAAVVAAAESELFEGGAAAPSTAVPSAAHSTVHSTAQSEASSVAHSAASSMMDG